MNFNAISDPGRCPELVYCCPFGAELQKDPAMNDVTPNNVFDPSQVELLFVDDDDDFRKTAAQRFARRGFRVQEAPGVNDALRHLQDRQFDVVVSDFSMPGLTGID